MLPFLRKKPQTSGSGSDKQSLVQRWRAKQAAHRGRVVNQLKTFVQFWLKQPAEVKKMTAARALIPWAAGLAQKFEEFREYLTKVNANLGALDALASVLADCKSEAGAKKYLTDPDAFAYLVEAVRVAVDELRHHVGA